MKYTPGPWKKNSIGLYGSDGTQVLATANLGLAFQSASGEGGQTRLANDRLIAAAPELFVALQGMCDCFDESLFRKNTPAAMANNRAAALLARIKGEA